MADLIWETKKKNFIYYDLNTSVVEELLLWLKDLKGDESHDGKNINGLCYLAAFFL